MLLNVKARGSSVALGQCGCCGVGKSKKNMKAVSVKKTFDGACEEVFGVLNRYYGEPKVALAEIGREIVEKLGFGERG